MDIRAINPKVYEMWKMRHDFGGAYFKPSSPEDIAAIETALGTKVPSEYREFSLQYSTVGAVPSVGAYYFKCNYPSGSIIDYHLTLVPWASLTLEAINVLHNPHHTMENVGARIPKELMPLTYDNEATLLIDLRTDTFGQILYMPSIKRRTFGTAGFGWSDIGYVSVNLTEFFRELDTAENQVKKYGLRVRN